MDGKNVGEVHIKAGKRNCKNTESFSKGHKCKNVENNDMLI